MERIRQHFNRTDKLEKVAEFYGYSLWRLHDQIVARKVIGITYERGHGIRFYGDSDYEMLDPVPDLTF